ncbi:24915_t:CDS:2 [Gigaspora margarita]|uniref:24915_t:CDS:1 n=1 Tax=Gigaspora margarita TaxID=4874 RepID=A0ABN7UPH7_GIGMA|nr:24915_t:CDS:2 [Gigaspora margarita]
MSVSPSTLYSQGNHIDLRKKIFPKCKNSQKTETHDVNGKSSSSCPECNQSFFDKWTHLCESTRLPNAPGALGLKPLEIVKAYKPKNIGFEINENIFQRVVSLDVNNFIQRIEYTEPKVVEIITEESTLLQDTMSELSPISSLNFENEIIFCLY